MIEQIAGLPKGVVGFRAKNKVDADDFKREVMPVVEGFINKHGVLNYILVLDTPLKNFTVGSFVQDAVMGLKHLLKWNRVAIVSDKESVLRFTDLFSKFIPGEFRGYEHDRLQEAIDWCAGTTAK